MKKHYQTILILFIFLLACTNQQKHEKEINEVSLEIKENRKPIKHEVYYRFPSPKDIMGSMQDVNTAFNHGILLPAENMPRVVGSINQELLMGMYFTDFGYALAEKKFNLSRKYFANLLELGIDTRLTEYMDSNLHQRIENNYDNIDSLETISDEVYQSIFNYLEVSGSEQTIALVSAGSIIEAFHVGMGLMQNCEDISQSFSQKIVAQKYALANLIAFMDDISLSGPAIEVRNALQEILILFNEVPVKKSATKVEKQSGSIILSGGETFSMTRESCAKINEKVTHVRSNILDSHY